VRLTPLTLILIHIILPINHRLPKRFKFDEGYRSIFPDVSVKAMPVLHGTNDTLGDYESSAFFIRHDPSGQEFLFFGDVSPDSLTSNPQTIAVWRAAAPKIPTTLSTIFIECSWPSGRPDEQLYGHLSPEHLVDELAVLAAEVAAVRAAKSCSRAAAADDDDDELPKKKRRRRNKSVDVDTHTPAEPLAGLRIYVTHCKDDLERTYSRPIYHVIRDQVEALVRAKGLGAEVLSAEQGMTISMFATIFREHCANEDPRSYLVLPFTPPSMDFFFGRPGQARCGAVCTITCSDTHFGFALYQ